MLSIAIGCGAVLTYTYFGYPALIGALARLRPLSLSEDPSWEPTVTVCIAAYNAAATLEEKLSSVLAQDYPKEKLEVLVYSDGATDATDEIVRAWSAKHPAVKLVEGRERRGKPTALNRMHDVATGEVLLITDSRQPLVPGALRALLRRLGNPLVGCVTGNLVLKGQAGSGFYWKYENWIRRKEAAFRSVVGMTGPIAALRKEDLVPLPSDIILDDIWIPMHLRLKGRRVLFAEDAIAYDQAFGDEREFGRKVRTLAGNYQVFARMPALLSPIANPSWFETISHKILRLVCPWALAGLLVSSVVGALAPAGTAGAGILGALAIGQAGFYAAAAAGTRAGKLGSVARTFVVLNVAAVVGLWRFLRGSQRITW